MVSNKIEKINDSGDVYTVEPVVESIKTNKKSNVLYWDGLEEEVEEFIKKIAKDGGVDIKEIGDLNIVKEVTEFVTDIIEKRFTEAEFPYVDQDF